LGTGLPNSRRSKEERKDTLILKLSSALTITDAKEIKNTKDTYSKIKKDKII
jgi:hypothetical protein